LNTKFNGKVLFLVGILGFTIKLIEPIIITKGCFGTDYLYEILTFGIPIAMIVVGYKKIYPKVEKKKKRKRILNQKK